MMKTLIFWILLVNLVLGEPEELKIEKRDVKALHTIVASLSTLSRVTSSLALQSTLGTAPTATTIANFLMLQSSEPITKLTDVSFKDSDALQDVIKLAQGVRSNVSNQNELMGSLNGLAELANSAELRSQANLNLTEYLQLAPSIINNRVSLEPITNSPILTYSGILSHFMSMSAPTSEKEQHELDTNLVKLRVTLAKHVLNTMELVRYQVTYKTVLDFRGKNQVLKELEQLRNATEHFEHFRSNVLTENFKELIESQRNFEGIQNKTASIQRLLSTLQKTLLISNELQVRAPKQQLLTSSEVSTVFQKDLKSTWLLKAIAANQKDLQVLQKMLEPLQKFHVKVEGVKKAYEEFKMLNQTTELNSTILEIQKTQEFLTNETLHFHEELSEQMERLSDCVLNFTTPNATLLQEFHDFYNFANQLDQEITSSFEHLADYFKNPAVIDVVRVSSILHEVDGPGSEWDKVIRLRGSPDVVEFSKEANKAAELMRKAGSMATLLRTQKTSAEFQVLEDVRSMLNSSGIFEALECLKTHQIDTKIPKIHDLIGVGKRISELDLFPNGAGNISSFLEKLEAIQKSLEAFDGVKNKTKRGAPEFPLTAQNHLARGVHLLQNLVDVSTSPISKIPDYNEQIHTKIRAIPDPPMMAIWTEQLLAQFKNFSSEIEQLERAAELLNKTEDLVSLGTIFNASKRVKGAQVDARMLGTPIAEMLRSEGEQEIADELDGMKELELDYAQHSVEFASAAESLAPIQKYFDGVFGIQRATPEQEEKFKEKVEKEAQERQKEHAEEEASQMYFIITLVVLVLLVIIAFLIYFFVFRKKKEIGAKTMIEQMWRHLRFLEEGQLLPNEGVQYTPLHFAVLNKNLEEAKRRIKNGADVNVHSFGKTAETPLHTAVSLEHPELVELLLRNGASVMEMDQNYETPKDRARGRPMVRKVLKEHESKMFPRVPPKEFLKFRIFLDEHSRGSAEGGSNVQKNIVEKLEEATHIVVKTGKDGVLDLDAVRDSEGDGRVMTLLRMIFNFRILMCSQWLDAARLRPTDFQNDAKFRVKEVKFKEVIYRTIDEIQEDFQRMHIPYLTNATVHFHQPALHTVDWKELKACALALGAQLVEEFPLMQAILPGQPHPFYRDDLGSVFVVFLRENESVLQESHAMLRADKSYTFMERDEFIIFLLAHKINHKKLLKRMGSVQSTEEESSTPTGARSNVGSVTLSLETKSK